MAHIAALIFLIIGFIFGKAILNQQKKNYDLYLLLLAAFFLIFGDNTIVYATANYKLTLSHIIPSFIAGALLRRYIFNITTSFKLNKINL